MCGGGGGGARGVVILWVAATAFKRNALPPSQPLPGLCRTPGDCSPMIAA